MRRIAARDGVVARVAVTSFAQFRFVPVVDATEIADDSRDVVDARAFANGTRVADGGRHAPAIFAHGELGRDRQLRSLCRFECLFHERENALFRRQVLADESVDDRAGFDQRMEFALLANARNQIDGRIRAEMDAVRVVARVLRQVSADVTRRLREVLHVDFRQAPAGPPPEPLGGRS